MPNETRNPAPKGPRILIVDDDPGQRSLLDSFLRSSGFETVLAASGESALELLRAEVVRSWSANGDATQAQAILRAMERMREKIELGWAQDFTARLSGLDRTTLVDVRAG